MTSIIIETVSHQAIDLIDPNPEHIHILDIAHGLAFECRWYNQIAQFYSVAQHSVMVSRLVPARHQLWGLLHDASEAYIGDCSRPVKESPLMTGYRMIEADLMRAVKLRFGLKGQTPASVKTADRIALATEFRDLRGYGEDRAMTCAGALPMRFHIVPENAETARRKFLDRYREITSRELGE